MNSLHRAFFTTKTNVNRVKMDSAVFILGAKWIALVRGWRSDCVVGGLETRFQCHKVHSRTAKCEAFHVAPKLFFRFLFLIPSTIQQQCIIYAPSIYPLNRFFSTSIKFHRISRCYSSFGGWGFQRACWRAAI